MATIKTLPCGVTVIEGDTHLTKWIGEGGKLCHDPTVEARILPHIPAGGFAIDGGASIGDHTIAYASKAGLVLAFEPFETAYQCLVENMKAAKSKVICEKAALSNRNEPLTFHVEESCNYGASRIVQAPVSNMDSYVQGIRLDTFLAQKGITQKVDFIKLDVEGYELFALEGMIHTLHKDRPTILLEMNAGHIASNRLRPDDIFHFLDAMHYKHTPLCENYSQEMYDLLCNPK